MALRLGSGRRRLVPEIRAGFVSQWFAWYLAAPQFTKMYLIRQLSFPNLSQLLGGKATHPADLVRTSSAPAIFGVGGGSIRGTDFGRKPDAPLCVAGSSLIEQAYFESFMRAQEGLEVRVGAQTVAARLHRVVGLRRSMVGVVLSVGISAWGVQ